MKTLLAIFSVLSITSSALAYDQYDHSCQLRPEEKVVYQFNNMNVIAVIDQARIGYSGIQIQTANNQCFLISSGGQGVSILAKLLCKKSHIQNIVTAEINDASMASLGHDLNIRMHARKGTFVESIYCK